MEEDYAATTTRAKPTTPGGSDLLSSAKLIADAAKSAMSHDSDKIDKPKLATAAADLLQAAKHYGKLEDKNLAKYLDKAQAYLHHYHSSHSSSSTAPASSGAAHHGGGPVHGGDGHSGGGGYGDYVKLAQGLFNKQEHGGDGAHGHSSGGAGDYIKLAQGLLNKQNHGGDGEHGHSSTGDYIKLAQGFLKKH